MCASFSHAAHFVPTTRSSVAPFTVYALPQTPNEFWSAFEEEVSDLNYPATEAIGQARWDTVPAKLARRG